MSGIETEIKFAIKKKFGTPWRDEAQSKSEIRQGYIPAEGCTVRVRQRGEKAFLTIKEHKGAGAISRYEFEKEISLDEAEHLFLLCKGFIEKTRYLVDYRGHTFEIDEFHGENEGLLLAEVELRSEEEAFETPEYLGMRVSHIPYYYNSFITNHPYPTWREKVPEEYR